MTPAEIREAVARLVEAGAKATPGEWRWVGMTLENDFYDDVIGLETKGSPWMEYQEIAMGNRDADQAFIATAANARPALAALAGMCVLPVEVVRVLVEAMLVVSRAEGLSREWLAALAAAEAEVARVEVAP